MDDLFVITSSEDGLNIVRLSKREAELRHRRGYWGDNPVFLEELPDIDKGCFMGVPERAVLVIAGDIVRPRTSTAEVVIGTSPDADADEA